MKPVVRGKTIFLREIEAEDAEFVLKLRSDPNKNKFISTTSSDITSQIKFIDCYKKSLVDYYFIICNWKREALGTIRIYDIRNDSFCWGSWIINEGSPPAAAFESALLLYDYAFFALHYKNSHFDVRKDNKRIVEFHKRFGAKIIDEDGLNFYFNFSRDDYIRTREKYSRIFP